MKPRLESISSSAISPSILENPAKTSMSTGSMVFAVGSTGRPRSWRSFRRHHEGRAPSFGPDARGAAFWLRWVGAAAPVSAGGGLLIGNGRVFDAGARTRRKLAAGVGGKGNA